MTKALSWRHHTLIQALLSRGPLQKDEVYSILSQLFGKSQDRRSVDQHILEISEKLAYVQMDLRMCQNQYDGNIYYGVVNNVADEQSKLGTKYSAPQIAYYKGIIEAIVQDTAGQGSISNTSALNIRLENQIPTGVESQPQGSQIPPAFRNFTMTQKDKTLEEFVRDQWLCSTSDGKIGLGVRSFLDLRSWFRNNEVPICEFCNEAAVKADLCQNEECNIRLHLYCLKKKFPGKKIARVCPGCSIEWRQSAEAEIVGEEDDPSPPTQNPQPSSRKRRRTFRPPTTSEASSCGSSAPDAKRVTRSSSRVSSSQLGAV